VTAALANFGESVRNAIDESTELGDIDTSDLFTEISGGVDQHLWVAFEAADRLLRGHYQSDTEALQSLTRRCRPSAGCTSKERTK
jgi:hypothetical protein